MNVEKHLILIKNEDKTEQIKYCEYGNGKLKVTYYNNSAEYHYNYTNVEWYRNPKEISPDTHVVYENNQPISGIMKIL